MWKCGKSHLWKELMWWYVSLLELFSLGILSPRQHSWLSLPNLVLMPCFLCQGRTLLSSRYARQRCRSHSGLIPFSHLTRPVLDIYSQNISQHHLFSPSQSLPSWSSLPSSPTWIIAVTFSLGLGSQSPIAALPTSTLVSFQSFHQTAMTWTFWQNKACLHLPTLA